MIARIILTSISFLLAAAHFYRLGINIVAYLCLALPFLFFIKKRIILIVLQVILYLMTIEWIRSTLNYIQIRENEGTLWLRLALILGGVALFTLMSGILLNFGKIKEKYD